MQNINTVLVIYDALINSKIDRENFFMTLCRINDACSKTYCSVNIELLVPESVIGALTEEYGELSADTICLFRTKLENQTLLDYGANIFSYCLENRPQYVFFPSSIIGRNLSAWLGAKMEAGVVADVIDLEYLNEDESFKYIRATAESELLARIKCNKKPEIVSIRGKRNQESNKRKPVFKNIDFGTNESGDKIQIMERRAYSIQNFSDNIVIGVGRGVSAFDFEIIKTFADMNKIPIMGSKPAIESKLLGRDKQIGQSGNFIHTDIYIAIGISGAPQHVVGILDCKKIIAINTDRNAPIHNYSDISILLSAHDVFSSLISV